jgi:hypothetical protein
MKDNPQSTGKENQERNYLSLTREQLYELVWSKPMQHLAKDYGSPIAQWQSCAPVTRFLFHQGVIWAKKGSGRKVVQTPLPPFVPKEKPKPEPPEPEVQKPSKKKPKLSGAWEDREKKINKYYLAFKI